jgi:hypothetical protein
MLTIWEIMMRMMSLMNLIIARTAAQKWTAKGKNNEQAEKGGEW